MPEGRRASAAVSMGAMELRRCWATRAIACSSGETAASLRVKTSPDSIGVTLASHTLSRIFNFRDRTPRGVAGYSACPV